jgi:hypothetical protein
MLTEVIAIPPALSLESRDRYWTDRVIPRRRIAREFYTTDEAFCISERLVN